jgi:hypothetical protein
LRIDARELIARHHVDDRPDNAAIEAPCPAQDQDHQHVGGALEAQRLERHRLGGLRQQRTGDARHHGSDCISLADVRLARRPDRRHAHRVLADAAQREAERRRDQPAHHQEHQKQHGERIGVADVAPEIEREVSEQRPHPHALQAIGAAGEPMRAVRSLGEQQAEAERDHDQGEMAEARDDEAREIAEQPGRGAGDQEPGQRLAPAPLRDQARGIGAEAEEGRMAERHDASVAEDEVEREREQRRDGDLARQLQVARGDPERQQRGEPERDLDRAPTRLRDEVLIGIGDSRDRHRLSAFRTGRPAATSTA